MQEKSKLEEYKNSREGIGNNPKIKNPRFSFLYTVNLDGRIRLEPINDWLRDQGLFEEDKGTAKFFEKLISQEENQSFKYENPENHLPHFLDDHFLRKAILGIWNIKYTEEEVWKAHTEDINKYLQSLFNYNIQHEHEHDDFSSVPKNKFDQFSAADLEELEKEIIKYEENEKDRIYFNSDIDDKSLEECLGNTEISKSNKKLCKDIWKSCNEQKREKEDSKITIEFVKSDTDKPHHTPQIKLFTTGGLGILIEFELRLRDKDGNLIPKDINKPKDEKGNFIPMDIFLKASDCIKLIEYPNLVKNLDMNEYILRLKSFVAKSYFPQNVVKKLLEKEVIIEKDNPEIVCFNSKINSENKLKECIKAIEEKEKVIAIWKKLSGSTTGILNAVSFSVCQFIFEQFMERIDNVNGKLLEIEKINGIENVIENYKGAVSKKNFNDNKLVKKLLDGEIIKEIEADSGEVDKVYFGDQYKEKLKQTIEGQKHINNEDEQGKISDIWEQSQKNKRYFAPDKPNIYPYVGILFKDLPDSVSLSDSDSEKSDKGCRLLFALANQTVAFLDNFMEPYKYLKKKGISRGHKDAIIIERRGLVAAGSRSPNWDDFLNNAYATLILCLESLLATTKSVSTLNKDIEQFISKEISKLLKEPKSDILLSREELKDQLQKLEKVSVKLSKARTLSPCEDISTSILPHIKSRVSYEGTKRFKTFTLDDLVDLAHSRLTNYGHFLKAEEEKLGVNYDLRKDKSLIRLTHMTVFIGSTIVTLGVISSFSFYLKFPTFVLSTYFTIKYFKAWSKIVIDFFEKNNRSVVSSCPDSQERLWEFILRRLRLSGNKAEPGKKEDKKIDRIVKSCHWKRR